MKEEGNCMRTLTKLATVAVVLAMAAPVAFGYSGTLNYSDGQITATNAWAAAGTSMFWEVTQAGSVWNYKYVLTVAATDISHLIIETSDGVALGTDLYGFGVVSGSTSTSFTTLLEPYASGPSNPNMPSGGMYGVKIQGVPVENESTQWMVTFASTRRPVWGDFYAKCGGIGASANTAFNTGFTGGYFDPYNVVTRNGITSDNQIAVPDTTEVIPELGSTASALMGLPVLVALRRRYGR